MKRAMVIFLCVLFLSHGGDLTFACTIFNMTRSGITFVGNNEDGTDPITYLWFLPAERGKYGRVYFALSDKWPQGGMNDQGLFYDGTACPFLEVTKSMDRPTYRGNLSEKILEECASVDEAVALLQRYNLSYFRNGQMMIVDRFGNSAIVEGDTIIYKKGSYQIATNFYQSNRSLGGYPCPRYDIAESMLKNIEGLSFSSCRAILEAVHLEGISFTQYSIVFNLNQRMFYYFRDSNFDQFVKINLQEELESGERWYRTEELFEQKDPTEVQRGDVFQYQGQYENRDENGVLRCQISFLDGKLNGSCLGWYPDGNKAWKSSHDNGKPSGIWEQWDESGVKMLEIDFRSSFETSVREFYPSGRELARVTLTKGGVDRILLDNTTVKHENGVVSYNGVFRNNALYLKDEKEPFTGELLTFYAGGQKHMSRSFREGRRDGETIRWSKSGKVTAKESYRNGTLLSIERY